MPSSPSPLATLRFFAPKLQPALMNLIVPVKPDAAASAGEPIATAKNGDPVKAKVGTWFISTKGKGLGSKPESHLLWVVNLAKTHINEIKDEIPDIQVSFSLFIYDRAFSPSRDLPRYLVEQATSIGELEIDSPLNDINVIVDAKNYLKIYRHA
jgi:hypothetical protein